MDRRNFLGGLIAMPAIIRVADIMRVKPVRYSFDDIIELEFNNGMGGIIKMTPVPNPTIAPQWTMKALPTRDPYITGMLWNDMGTLRFSEG